MAIHTLLGEVYVKQIMKNHAVFPKFQASHHMLQTYVEGSGFETLGSVRWPFQGQAIS